MKFLSSLIGIVVLLVAVTFAIANRQMATVSLWPLDMELQAPLCLLTLGPFVFGLLLGIFLTWAAMLPYRLKTRRMRKDLAALQDKIGEIQQTVIPPYASEDDALLPPPQKRRFWRTRL